MILFSVILISVKAYFIGLPDPKSAISDPVFRKMVIQQAIVIPILFIIYAVKYAPKRVERMLKEEKMEEIDNPLLTLSKNHLLHILEAHGKQIMGKLKNELDENDPAEILRQILSSNNNEYINDNFEIYQRDQAELDKELDENENE